MLEQTQDIIFHSSLSGTVDKQNHVIRGVSLITGDLEAEGHGLHVDDTTLGQVHGFGVKRGKVPVKMDHKGADGKTFTAICGYLENFSWDKAGKKVRGDLHLLSADAHTPKIEEMAERMPECFGLSVACKGAGKKGANGKNFARFEKLLSVDLVEHPAANPDGLFSAQVDSGSQRMPTDIAPTTPTQEPTLAQVLAAIAGLQTTVTKQNETIATLQKQVEGLGDPEGDGEQVLVDAEGYVLDADGQRLVHPETGALITRAEAEAEGLVCIAQDGTAQTQVQTGTVTAPGATAQPGASTGAAPAVIGAPGTALHTLSQSVVNLSAQLRNMQAAAQRQREEIEFAQLDENIKALIAERDAAIDLAEKFEGKCAALELSLKTGVKPVASSPEGTTLFSADAKKAEGSAVTFESLVNERYQHNLSVAKLTDIKAKSEALDFTIRKHPTAYREYRARGSKPINLAAK